MLQTIVVAVIVAGAAFFVIRPLLPKALRSRKGGCGSDEGGCACGKDGD